MQRKKRITLVLLPLLLVCALVVVLLAAFRGGREPLLEIGGVPVYEEEYQLVMRRHIADVSGQFPQPANTEAFWNTAQNGQLPIDVLRKQTYEELLYNHTIYRLAYEAQLIEEQGYDSFLKRMEDENNRRAENIANGEPVYGLSVFSATDYLDYELDKLTQQLMEKEKDAALAVSEQDIASYYEANKNSTFKVEDIIEVEYIYLPYGELEEPLLSDAMQALQALYLQAGGETISIYEVAQQNDLLAAYAHSQQLDPELYSTVARSQPFLLDILASMEAGELSEPIDTGEGYALVYCKQRTPQGYEPLEDVQQVIEKRLLEEKFEQLVAEKMAEAAVVEHADNVEKVLPNK